MLIYMRMYNIYIHVACYMYSSSFHLLLSNVCICDRPREKLTEVGKKFSWDFYGFRIYLAVRIFAENLVRLARCIDKIWLFLCPVKRETSIVKTDKFVREIRADNFSPFIRPYTRVM